MAGGQSGDWIMARQAAELRLWGSIFSEVNGGLRKVLSRQGPNLTCTIKGAFDSHMRKDGEESKVETERPDKGLAEQLR